MQGEDTHTERTRPKLNFLDRFDLRDAVPLETEPRAHTLRFLTQYFRQFGDFDFLNQYEPPEIFVVDPHLVLSTGTHRGIWYCLNGLLPEFPVKIHRFSNQKDIDHNLNLVQRNIHQQVYSIRSLAAMVKDPDQYRINGPVTVKMSQEEIRMGIRYSC